MLVMTLYEAGDEDRYKIFAIDEHEAETEVTDQYEVFATTLVDGRQGWSVVKKDWDNG